MLDRERGADELLRAALSWLEGNPESLEGVRLTPTLSLLQRTRPAMAGFTVLAERLERRLAGSEPVGVLQDLIRQHQDASEQLIENAVALLAETAARAVVTLSYSSTVASVIETAQGRLREVHVLESEPGGEGRRLVRRLRQSCPALEGVIAYPDADIGTAVARSDAGVIGADTVYEDGSVLNKSGSAALGRLLGEADKPLYALATTWKIRTVRRPPDVVDDALFEHVPAENITRIVSE